MKKVYALFFVFLILCAASYAAAGHYIILERNIFSAPEPPPVSEKPVQKTSILRPPQLPDLNSLIELKGLVYFGDGDSFAVINIKKKNEEFIFREGDFIGEAEIAEIREDGVVFVYQEKKVEIGLPKEQDGGFVPVSPGLNAKVEVPALFPETEKSPGVSAPPVLKEPVLLNFEKTLTEMRKDTELMKNLNVAPNMKDGKVEGFRVGNIASESILYEYGLRDGDVVRRINGVLIDSMAKGFAVYNQITQDRTGVVTVEVLRNNNPVIFTFRLQ